MQIIVVYKNERGYLNDLREKYPGFHLLTKYDDITDMYKHKEVTLIGISDDNEELLQYQSRHGAEGKLLVVPGVSLIGETIGDLVL